MSSENNETQAAATPSSASTIRLIVLLVVLVAMASALGWDQFVSRPGSQKAYDDVHAMITRQNLATGLSGMKSEKDVQKLLGCTPSAVDEKDYYAIETYSWRRGLLFTTYDVNVLYHIKKDGWQLRQVILYDMPEEHTLPQGPSSGFLVAQDEKNNPDGGEKK